MMKKIILLSILLLGTIVTATSQEEQVQYSPDIELKYYNINHSKKLVAFLKIRQKREVIPVVGSAIVFYIGVERIQIGEVVTKPNGIATLVLDGLTNIKMDQAGMYNFSASYKGTKNIDAADASISITEVDLSMVAEMIDSVKTIRIHAKKIIPDTTNNLITDEGVNVYVTRMFSPLLLSEEKLNESGDINLEFPTNIPGDKEGNINVIAKIEDHELYGNVEISTIINWGTATIAVVATERSLSTEGAPFWMIIALSIMLLGVWGHYIYAIIQLIIIRKLGKKEKNNLKNNY